MELKAICSETINLKRHDTCHMEVLGIYSDGLVRSIKPYKLYYSVLPRYKNNIIVDQHGNVTAIGRRGESGEVKISLRGQANKFWCITLIDIK